MSNPNQFPAMETQDTGVFERVEAAFRNSRIGQLATIGIASLGMTIAAEAYTAEPAGAENVPTTTSTLTPDTTQSVEQECVNIALSGRLPTPVKDRPTMFNAGIRPRTPGQLNSNEWVNGGYNFELLPDGSNVGEPDCSGIHRSVNIRLQMEDANAKHRGRFFTMDTASGDPDEYSDGSGVVSIGISHWGATGSDIIFNQCPDGKHWLKVREKATIVAEDAQTDRTLGSRIYNWAVRVKGSCRAAARSARLVTGFGARKPQA